MADHSEVCCFCECQVAERTMKTKRKKVHGSSMKTALGIMDQISIEVFQSTASSFLARDTFMCHKCKKRLEDLPELLRKAEVEVIDKIKNMVDRCNIVGRARRGNIIPLVIV
jgi:hypothetical protein